LGLIIELLKITSATTAKVWARWLNPVGRAFDHFHNRGESHIAFDAINSHTQAIARRRERDHHGAAIRVREPKSAGQDSFDENF
jgi:hypothetical protein